MKTIYQKIWDDTASPVRDAFCQLVRLRPAYVRRGLRFEHVCTLLYDRQFPLGLDDQTLDAILSALVDHDVDGEGDVSWANGDVHQHGDPSWMDVSNFRNRLDSAGRVRGHFIWDIITIELDVQMGPEAVVSVDDMWEFQDGDM